MFSIPPAHFIHLHKQHGSTTNNNQQANECIHPTDIKNSKEYKQCQQPSAQIPDVLSFQPFEFNRTVNPFINLINTGTHFILFPLLRLPGPWFRCWISFSCFAFLFFSIISTNPVSDKGTTLAFSSFSIG